MPDTPDYEVGYGRPPQHSRFQKGQSGNPKGARSRRKMRKEEIVAMVRDELVPIRLNGREIKIQAFEAAVRATFARVMKSGSPRDLEKLLLLMERYGAQDKAEAMEEMRKESDKVMEKLTDIFHKTFDYESPEAEAAAKGKTHSEAVECTIIQKHAQCLGDLKRHWREMARRNDDFRARTSLQKQMCRS